MTGFERLVFASELILLLMHMGTFLAAVWLHVGGKTQAATWWLVFSIWCWVVVQ